MPPEYLLISNLKNPKYLELVLGGSLDTLPSKLADSSIGGTSFARWRETHSPRLLGQLPRAVLRSPVILDNLLQISATHSQPDDADAA